MHILFTNRTLRHLRVKKLSALHLLWSPSIVTAFQIALNFQPADAVRFQFRILALVFGANGFLLPADLFAVKVLGPAA
jgi:hypothetical protein